MGLVLFSRSKHVFVLRENFSYLSHCTFLCTNLITRQYCLHYCKAGSYSTLLYIKAHKLAVPLTNIDPGTDQGSPNK